MSELLKRCEGFQWDKGNTGKNWLRHQVTDAECEQVFFNKPLIIADDPKHSRTEKRSYMLGHTEGQWLTCLKQANQRLIELDKIVKKLKVLY